MVRGAYSSPFFCSASSGLSFKTLLRCASLIPSLTRFPPPSSPYPYHGYEEISLDEDGQPRGGGTGQGAPVDDNGRYIYSQAYMPDFLSLSLTRHSTPIVLTNETVPVIITSLTCSPHTDSHTHSPLVPPPPIMKGIQARLHTASQPQP